MSETAPPLIQLVGIVNLSEQSFNQLGRFSEPSAAVDYIGKLLSPGVADKIDIGGEATNPNVSGEAAVDDEWGRLEPILRQVLPDYPDFSFSIDTRHPEIISRVVEVARGKLFY
ncbi:MAG TPA: dihydropteroate synthase, partial [Candidatus Saccharimonadales bacterium]